MLPELFRIPLPWGGPENALSVPAYGTMLMIGFLLAVFLTRRRAHCVGLEKAQVFDLGFCGIIGGILGARMMHVAVFWPHYFVSHEMWPVWMGPLGWLGAMVSTWKGGLVYYGGLLGGLLAVWIYARRRRIPLADLLDFAAPGGALGLAVTRIGCFLNGCCHGGPTAAPDPWWGVHYPSGSPAWGAYGDVSVHPAQLYEAAAALGICAFLWFMYPRRRYAGQIACWFGLLYSVWRFCNEFLRGDSGPWRPEIFGRICDFGPLTVFQYLSLVMLAGFAAALFAMSRRARAPYRPPEPGRKP
jgi:phosphatidylglycerol:prolipoprotein diacylglycerol transferase